MTLWARPEMNAQRLLQHFDRISEAPDAVMRMMVPRLLENIGHQVVVENRLGGAATIGMDVVAKSPPDGYTLGGANLTFSINPILLKKMPYDSDKDLALVSHITIVPFILAVHPSVPARCRAQHRGRSMEEEVRHIVRDAAKEENRPVPKLDSHRGSLQESGAEG